MPEYQCSIMKQIEKTPDLLEIIREFEAFQGIKDESLQWLIDQSEYLCYEKGEEVITPGAVTDHMYIVVYGEFAFEMEQNGEWREMGTVEEGAVTGILPFSRMKSFKGRGEAIKDCCILGLHRNCFTEMVNVDYDLVQNLVGLMSDRVRNFTSLQVQNEKLLALGKLSAGLAHELNNPASAMVRSAKELHDRIHKTPEKFKQVMTLRITDLETDKINEILFQKIEKGINEDLSALEKSEIEDDILDWLEDRDIDKAEDIANTFAEYEVSLEELEQLEEIMGDREYALGPLLFWLESTLNLETLINEIQESADRISTLINSIKSYSHMDRSGSKDKIQLKEGIYNTLMILKHKLKKKNINLVKEFEENLPMVEAHVSELNQVWTNIIDNAIDAMDQGGDLMIRAYRQRKNVSIEITDNGPGIPDDVINRIFDPFFTTKGVGEGTGMGLDITKKIIDRMKGQIKVESEPGKTTFQILIPVSDAA